MTEEEALDKLSRWSARERATYELLVAAYRALRGRLGPGSYITREALIREYGGGSIGTASKFMDVIETLEGDQPCRGRARTSEPHKEEAGSQPAAHPAGIQTAFNVLLAAVEGVSKAVAVERAREAADAAMSLQRLLDDQRAAANAKLQAAEARLADLEVAACGAGDESWDAETRVEEFRVSLERAKVERDEALAAAQQVAQRLEVELAHANTARAQIEALHNQVAAQADEIARLQADANWAREATDLGHRLRTENATLAERATALTAEVERFQEMLRQSDLRHERERAEMRAEHDRVLADERRRAATRESLLMQMSGSDGQWRGGRS